MEITPLGHNWYHLYTNGSHIEYNTGPNPTAILHDERNPQASVFRHIDGNKAVVKIPGKPDKYFLYKDSGYNQAIILAKQYVLAEIGKNEIQEDLFRESA